MSLFSKMLGQRGKQPVSIRTTAGSPFCIPRPVIGFYCADPSHSADMQADRVALAPLFDQVREGSRDVPVCNVLCVYARIQADGGLENLPMRLRDLIKSAEAQVAILASDNDPKILARAVQPENGWNANIVLTIARKGEAFPAFFAKLFQAMREGKSMLMAWVELAPHGPSAGHAEGPDTMMLAEAGHIAFSNPGEARQG